MKQILFIENTSIEISTISNSIVEVYIAQSDRDANAYSLLTLSQAETLQLMLGDAIEELKKLSTPSSSLL